MNANNHTLLLVKIFCTGSKHFEKKNYDACMTKSQCVVFPFQCALLKWQSQIENSNLCSTQNETFMWILTHPEHYFFQPCEWFIRGEWSVHADPPNNTQHGVSPQKSVYLRALSICDLALIAYDFDASFFGRPKYCDFRTGIFWHLKNFSTS